MRIRAPEHPGDRPGHASARDEPIAVVGLACRLPKAATPEALWALVEGKVDAVGEIPRERWDAGALYDSDPAATGKSRSKWAALLERIDGFDAEFFRVSPREAVQLDPQQRLLLELAWEALEDAGIADVAATRTGVFVGAMWSDYGELLQGRPDRIDLHTITGQSASVLAGRISHVFGLRGPSLVVNTASSSSLVAIHLACESLRRGESTLALAAGVNLILNPDHSVALSKVGAFSPDGRSRAFDARANGMVRGEGAVVVALKPLARALADGDPVHAVILGSALNNDGFTPGLMAPSEAAQAEMLREAYAAAGVDPAEVHYVETHGSGTPVGDPIEARALGAVLGQARAQPLRIGSVKTNIGHLEAAAGIAGFLKAVLALRARTLPPNLHFETPSPAIDFDGLRLRVQTELEAWPDDGRPPRAGVSSFGFGGTNCHVVLEAAPPPRAAANRSGPSLLVLSAHTPEALRQRAADTARVLRAREDTDAVCFTLGARRQHLAHRLAVAGEGREALALALEATVVGAPAEGTVQGVADPAAPRKVVFVFPGEGSQWEGMARGLLATDPDGAFAQALADCDAAIARETGWSVVGAIKGTHPGLALEQKDVLHPVLFAIAVALAAQWKAWGVVPDAVVGHSMGEIAAAHVAGALALEDAAALVCRRSALIARAAGTGAMALVDLPAADAERRLARYAGRVVVGVINGPRTTILSGETKAVEEVVAEIARDGVFARVTRIGVASHSPQMESLVQELRPMLAAVRGRSSAVAICSTVTAALIDGQALDAAYWARNLLEPVRFADAARSLAETGHDLFLEISPNPTLMVALEATLRAAERPFALVPSLQKNQDEGRTLRASLGALFVAGARVELGALWAARTPVALPTYPFRRTRYWVHEAPPATSAATRGGEQHPVLGRALALARPRGQRIWERDGAAGGLAMLVAAAAETRLGGAIALEGISLGEAGAGAVQTVVEDDGAIAIAAYDPVGKGFRPLAAARIATRPPVTGDEATAEREVALDGARDVDAWLRAALGPEERVVAIAHATFARGSRPAATVRVASGNGALRVLASDGSVLAELRGVLREARAPKPAASALRIAWEQRRICASAEREGSWLVALEDGEDEALAARLALTLGARGRGAVAVAPASRLVDTLRETARCAGVVLLSRAANAQSAPEDVAAARSIGALLGAIDGIRTRRFRDPPGIWVVSRGGGPAAASVAALTRAVAVDHPELALASVDLGTTGDDDLAALVAELFADPSEERVALRGGDRSVARLAPVPLSGPSLALREDATYLVAGRFEGLARATAAWLVARGARHLALVVPRGTPAPQVAGAHVAVAAIDLDDAGALAGALSGAFAELPPLRGVVYVADAGDEVDDASAAAAWNLHTQTQGLDLFALFGALDGLVGAAGAARAATFGFFEGLAQARREAGLPGLAVAWGPVAFRDGTSERATRLARRGMGQVTIDEGLETLEQLLRSDLASAVIGRLDPRQWLEVHPSVAGWKLWSELVATRSFDAAPSAFKATLAAAPEATRRGLLERFVRGEVAAILRLDPARVDPRAPLSEIGIVSLMGLELRNRLEAHLEVQIAPTLLANYPTVAALAAHFASSLFAPAKAPEPAKAAPPKAPTKLGKAVEEMSEAELFAFLDDSIS